MSAVSEQSTPAGSTSGARRTALESRLFKVLSHRGDVVLGALIVAVIGLLVVPLPTPLLDGLIATNLSASIALLMLSMNVPSALRLSTFPSLLLLTTLFRLSLNIASTKLILLNGAAGHIIDAFGRLVVGGNVIVGLVVFLIIAIVQFIVIAKGAERVAEVGARFSLDGMPGKQMSIDADLRAGLIDKAEAQRRRSDLEQESKLYGAMDGAMKFVKGDAIAGMLIAFVNIVAGVAIGVGMRGMSLGESVDTYSILSIGDGMVAQIPSLFVSIAAGIVLTRVGGRSGGRNHLGVQIAQEVLGHPAALLIAAVIVAGFLLVPGLPAWPFLLLALVLASAGYLARRAGTAADAAGDRSDTPAMLPDRAASAAAEGGAAATTAIAVPLRLRVAPGLSAGLSLSAFDVALEREKATLGRELGLPFPGLKLSVDDTLSGRQYAIDVQEVPVSQGDLQNGNVLAFAVREAGTSATADGTAPSQSKGAHSDNGSARPSPADTLAAHVAWVVRRYADSFIGMQETHELLTRAATQLPDLAAEVQKAVPLQRIADVLRRLVQEGVSIRYLREIFESLVVWSARENDIVMLTEYVRVDLGRFIVPRYVDGKNQLRAIVLDAEAEKALRESIQQSPSGSFLALAPEKAQALTAGAESALSRVGSSDGGAVVLAPMDVRRYLKKFLSSRFPNWAVLSFQELPPNVQLRAVGRLGLQAVTPRRSASNRL
jgi:type III secretion protein V